MTSEVKLGEVAEFIRGVTFKPDDVVPTGTPDSIWCMRTKNVQQNLDLSDVWSIDRSHAKRSSQHLQAGDILISSANSWNLVGKCCWVPKLEREATLGGFICALRGDESRILRRYLYHWFNSPVIQKTIRSFGRQTTNISNLDIKRCLELNLALPSIDDQRRIAAVLDQVDALREKRRKAIALLDDLAQSIFLDMFGDMERNTRGWTKVKFSDLVEGSPRNGLSPSKAGGVEAKVLTLSAVTGDRFDESAFKVSTFKSQPPAKQSVSARDFLVARGNGNISLVGKGFFPIRDMPDTTFPDTIIASRLDTSKLTPEYLEFTWRSTNIRRQIESSARTTNGTFKINQSTLESIEISAPPLSLQMQFSDRARAIAREKRSHADHLAALDALFASLQSRAFRSELWQHEAKDLVGEGVS